MMKITIITLAIVTALSACQQSKEQYQTREHAAKTAVASSLTQAIEGYTKDFLVQQPALATSLKLPLSLSPDYVSRWPDYSATGMQALQQAMTQGISALAAVNVDNLSPKEQLHLSVNKVIAHYYRGDLNFDGGYIDTWGGHLPYVVNQISGPLIDIPSTLKNQHSIESMADAEHYLMRLSALKSLTYEVQSKVLSDAKNGIVLPKVLFPNTLKYLTNYIDSQPQQHELVTNLALKLASLSDMSADQKSAMIEKATAIMANEVYPAFKSVYQTMLTLEQKAPTQVGIWAQPNGEKFYQHEITYLADSDLSADAIHQIGLDEVERINLEMDAILKSQGMVTGSVSERVAKLNEMEQFIYPDSDQGRQQLLDDLTADINKIMLKAGDAFATLPTQQVVVKRVPVASQDGAAGGSYSPPTIDGSRPGVFYINLKDMKAQPSYSLKTLTYHEAVPGHHFQISLNMAQQDIGIMRQNAPFNGYVEGWALYSELVAYEMGMYDNDPWGNLGRLQAEIYRAARLVVDTGLHHKKWTKQQAVDYFYRVTGVAMSDVESAIDRYIAWPGQALGYKLGMLKIVELRQWAQQALQDKFDIKAFHDVVLLPGARPLNLLEQDVKAWVKQVKAS